MLNPSEKEALYKIIIGVIGEDQYIEAYKSGFNERTVSIVEDMVEANINCNSNMRDLIKDLVGASSLMTQGWLKKVLKSSKKKIATIDFKGYGCLVTIKSRWKTAIISSTI